MILIYLYMIPYISHQKKVIKMIIKIFKNNEIIAECNVIRDENYNFQVREKHNIEDVDAFEEQSDYGFEDAIYIDLE